MSGLIILFWLLNGGEVLRYLVSVFSLRKVLLVELICRALLGAVHWRHVVSLCPLGRNWCGLFQIWQSDSTLTIMDGVTPCR